MDGGWPTLLEVNGSNALAVASFTNYVHALKVRRDTMAAMDALLEDARVSKRGSPGMWSSTLLSLRHWPDHLDSRAIRRVLDRSAEIEDIEERYRGIINYKWRKALESRLAEERAARSKRLGASAAALSALALLLAFGRRLFARVTRLAAKRASRRPRTARAE